MDSSTVRGCLLAPTSRKLHAHPLIADNSVADTRVIKLTLSLGAFSVAEVVLVQPALGVAGVFVFFFALGIVSTTMGKRGGTRVLLTMIVHSDCSSGFMRQ